MPHRAFCVGFLPKFLSIEIYIQNLVFKIYLMDRLFILQYDAVRSSKPDVYYGSKFLNKKKIIKIQLIYTSIAPNQLRIKVVLKKIHTIWSVLIKTFGFFFNLRFERNGTRKHWNYVWNLRMGGRAKIFSVNNMKIFWLELDYKRSPTFFHVALLTWMLISLIQSSCDVVVVLPN